MRALLILPFLVLAEPCVAAPQDATCAATFSALSASARAHGMASGEFDRMAAIAARHAGAAQGEGLRNESLTELSGRVVNCHARYDRSGADTRIAAAN